MLTHHQIVTSRKGKRGGFLLTKPAETISLYDIIKVIDGPNFLDRCVLGFPICSDTNPCPVHIDMDESQEDYRKQAEEKNHRRAQQEYRYQTELY